MYNHNKAQQSKNRVHIFGDKLYFTATGSAVRFLQTHLNISQDIRQIDWYYHNKTQPSASSVHIMSFVGHVWVYKHRVSAQNKTLLTLIR